MAKELFLMITAPVRVQANGRVTLPQAVRYKLKLKKGGLVTFVETAEGIVIKPAAMVVHEALDELAQALLARGVTLDDLLARGQEIRGQLVYEKYGLTDAEP
jgi:AbrB family looped-hinge helix DNA binding protein